MLPFLCHCRIGFVNFNHGRIVILSYDYSTEVKLCSVSKIHMCTLRWRGILSASTPHRCSPCLLHHSVTAKGSRDKRARLFICASGDRYKDQVCRLQLCRSGPACVFCFWVTPGFSNHLNQRLRVRLRVLLHGACYGLRDRGSQLALACIW